MSPTRAPGGGAPPPSFAAAARPRRLRRTATIRDAVAESDVESRRLIQPVFVRPGTGRSPSIPGLPGIRQLPVEEAIRSAADAYQHDVPTVLLFGVGRRRDPRGREAYAPDGVVPRTVRELKRLWPEMVVITDVCLCAYTDHGHCGVLTNGSVDNDRTLELLGRIAAVHAAAGADFVAPSAAMDHQVAHVRGALDAAGHPETGVIGHSGTFDSSFYDPVRGAVELPRRSADKAGYQLDVRNAREAEREVDLDVAEGADMVLVAPALPCLDIIHRAHLRSPVPVIAFQSSGEFAMLKSAAERGLIDERAAVRETIQAIRRAGADLIVTYYARQLPRWLHRSEE